MYRLTRRLIPTLDRFPSPPEIPAREERIHTTALTGLERLVEATLDRIESRPEHPLMAIPSRL